MTCPTSRPSPEAEEKKKSPLSRILAIATILIALLMLAMLAGWIFFHGLVAPNSFTEAPLVQRWKIVVYYAREKYREFVFDSALFLAGAVVVVLVVAARRVNRRLAIARQQRLARWESRVDPKEWPKLESDQLASRLQWITTIAQIGAGTALLIGIYFTYQNLNATREGQVTDRFIRAVDQIGATNKEGQPAREIRLGGIYGLRRIAQDSSEDYKPVREILSAYVRLNAPWHDEADAKKPAQPQQFESAPGFEEHPPEVDIQAALNVLGNPIEKFEARTPAPVSLPFTDLTGARLNDADLHDANLIGAHLDRANLQGAHLGGAYLWLAHLGRAHLQGAHLEGAQLEQADLASAQLEGAHLERAHLNAAHLLDAGLVHAHLESADLSNAVDLTQQEINSAFGDSFTALPAGLTPPESWKTAR